MPKARKKPVEIDYEHFVGDTYDLVKIYQWVEKNTQGSFEPMDVIEGRTPYPSSGVSIDPRDGRMIISTLEGLHWVDQGDYIIQGVAGEFYPCKPDIFAKTYDILDEDQNEEHQILIKGTFNGKEHEIPVKKWLPNNSGKYKKLGQELSVLIWSDGNLNDAHERTTYVIFKNVEQVEEFVPDEQ